MAIIDVVKFEGPPDVYAWRHPNQELSTWSQLIVHETQEAILFKEGQALDSFSAGRYTLSTANIPILSNFVNLPFGGESPFTAEVWFVNKLSSLDVKWGTSSPLELQDPKFNIIVSVRAYGQFGIQIVDARKFLLKLVGTLPTFDQDTLIKYYRGVLMSNINEIISSYIVHKKISVVEINAYAAEISKHIRGGHRAGIRGNGDFFAELLCRFDQHADGRSRRPADQSGLGQKSRNGHHRVYIPGRTFFRHDGRCRQKPRQQRRRHRFGTWVRIRHGRTDVRSRPSNGRKSDHASCCRRKHQTEKLLKLRKPQFGNGPVLFRLRPGFDGPCGEPAAAANLQRLRESASPQRQVLRELRRSLQSLPFLRV